MNDATHINQALWQSLLAGTLPEDERKQIVAHLDSDCETCDGIIAQFDQADALDGLVDDVLLDLGPPSADSFNELGFLRVKQKLKPRRISQKTWAGLASVMAAGLAAFFLMPTAQNQNPYNHLKGPETDAALRLEVLQSQAAQGIVPLVQDQSIQVGNTIVFRLRLNQTGCVQLFEDKEALFSKPKCFESGTHVIEENGQVLGLTLDRADIITYSAHWVDAQGKTQGAQDSVRLRVLP